MKTEKIIKTQAREALTGNITKLIAALGITALVFIAIEYLSYIPLYLAGIVNIDTGEITDTGNIWYLLTDSAVPAVMLFASPLISGFLKAAANTAVNKSCETGDVFYYFNNAGRYLKTIVFNLIVFGVFLTVSALLDPVRWFQLFAPDYYSLTPELSMEFLISVLALIAGFITKLLAYMIFVHFQLAGYALNDSRGIISSSFGMTGFALKNFGRLFKLMFSFFGWFALCFFVVPALYTAPYFAVASMQSARWLLEIENKGVSL